MFLSQNVKDQAAAILSAVSATGLMLMITAAIFSVSTVPAHAKSNPVIYKAELVQPATESRYIIRGTVFKCSGSECGARKSDSSTKTLCAKLAHKVGPLKSFSYKGKAMDEDHLAKCNAKSKSTNS